MIELTEDTILNGKITLFQPKKGYRVAIDPILLSHFVNIQPNQNILDVGCGVGTISLILKKKENTSEIFAIDIDETMCEICKKNSLKNALEINVINISIENIINNKLLKNKLFDHVVTNPPFFEQKSSRISKTKLLANFETIQLSDWILCCLKKVKNKGIFSIIHSAHRLNDILHTLNRKVGNIEIIPIYSTEKSDAIRVIVKCIKNSKAHTRISNSLLLHEKDGKYTDNLNEILCGKNL